MTISSHSPLATKADRAKYREGVESLIRAVRPEYMLTLAFNGPTHLQSAYAALRQFDAQLDRYLLGPKWNTKTPQRTKFIAFPEHTLSNFHYHLAVRFQCDQLPDELEDQISVIWKSLVPSGTAQLDPVWSRCGMSRYATKELFRNGHVEHFVLSAEFHSDSHLLARELRGGLNDWIVGLGFDWYAVAQFGRFVSDHEGRNTLATFKERIDKELGAGNGMSAIQIVAVPDIKDGKSRYHLLLAIPPGAMHWACRELEGLWNRIVPDGSLTADFLVDEDTVAQMSKRFLDLPRFRECFLLSAQKSRRPFL